MVGGLRVVDTEVFAQVKQAAPTTVQVLHFCPGKTTLPRLDAEATKYKRWFLNRVVITYEPTATISDAATVTYGILPGKPATGVSDDGKIMALRPFNKHAVWKGSSLTVSRNIMAQPLLYCNGDGDDYTAFCVYLVATDTTKGVFKIAYDLQLSYPQP